MDNLEAIIKAAAETVLSGTGTYTYARKAEFNLDHDKPAPHIVFFDPTGREKERTEDYNCLFMFAEPNPDTDAREVTQEIRSRMITLARRFFVELDKHDLIQLGEKPKEIMIREFQGRLSGIAYQCPMTIPLDLEC
jgi:hypothetical protein